MESSIFMYIYIHVGSRGPGRESAVAAQRAGGGDARERDRKPRRAQKEKYLREWSGVCFKKSALI